jgi:hypothetical protein
LGKVMAFRAMHLHGRILGLLIPRAGGRTWPNGHTPTASWSRGWCSGGTSATGTCTTSGCLATVQKYCGFAPGRAALHLRRVAADVRDSLAWRIADAASGELARGEVPVAVLRARQPWDEDPRA